MPLTEATAALFDGASARIAVPAGRQRASVLRATVPVQYRAEKAQAVQLGLRPMEAHLANLAPGGPGPLLLDGPAAVREQPAAAAPLDTAAAGAPLDAAAAVAAAPLDAAAAVALVKRMPAAYGPTGAVTAEWLATITAAAKITPAELTRALRQASARNLCGFAEWRGIMQLTALPM